MVKDLPVVIMSQARTKRVSVFFTVSSRLARCWVSLAIHLMDRLVGGLVRSM